MVEQDNRLSISLGRPCGEKRKRPFRVGWRIERAGRPLTEARTRLGERPLQRAQGAFGRIDPLISVWGDRP